MRFSLTILFLSCLAAVNQVCHAITTIQPIAFVGDPVPGAGDGTKISAFHSASINSSGRVALWAALDEPTDFAILAKSETSGLELIARTDDPDPDDPERYFLVVRDPYVDENSDVTFTGSIVGGGSLSEGSWTKPVDSELESVIVSGRSVPGTNDGTTIREYAGNNFAHNSVGQTAVVTTFNALGTDGGMLFHDGNESRLVARYCEEVTGLPGTGRLTGLGAILLVDTGELLFLSRLAESGTTDLYWSLLYGNPEGSFISLARTGDLAPQGNGATISRFGYYDINAASTIGFQATLSGLGVDELNVDAILRKESSGVLELVARSGDPAPGLPDGFFFDRPWTSWGPFDPPYRLASFRFYSVTQQGDLIFSGWVADSTGNTGSGYWIGDSDQLELLVLLGEQVPSMEEGVVFRFLGQINHVQQDTFMIEATLDGNGIDQTNDKTLWRVRDGVWHLMLREGQLAEVGPGDLRSVSGFYMKNFAGGDNGKLATINKYGDLLLDVDFEDGSSGLFVLNTVPEPTTSVLSLVALCLAVNCRRSKVQRHMPLKFDKRRTC
jgi:hypothetical protein